MRWRDLARAVVELVNEELNDTRVRVRHMIERGIVDRVLDSTGFQELTVQIHEGDDPVEGEHFHPNGLYNHANAGAETLVLRIGGNAAHAVMLAVAERALRPKGKAAGGTGLYPTSGPKAGQLVIWIDPATGIVHAGSEAADDFVALAGKVLEELQAIRSHFNTHTHTATSEGAPTLVPDQAMDAPSSVAATKLRAD